MIVKARIERTAMFPHGVDEHVQSSEWMLFIVITTYAPVASI